MIYHPTILKYCIPTYPATTATPVTTPTFFHYNTRYHGHIVSKITPPACSLRLILHPYYSVLFANISRYHSDSVILAVCQYVSYRHLVQPGRPIKNHATSAFSSSLAIHVTSHIGEQPSRLYRISKVHTDTLNHSTVQHTPIKEATLILPVRPHRVSHSHVVSKTYVIFASQYYDEPFQWIFSGLLSSFNTL